MFFKKKKKQAKVPQHIAFICDGNRRWARERGHIATYGYIKGADIVDDLSEFFIDSGVKILSFYIFSIENWGRESSEVKFLMDFFKKEMPKHVDRAHEKNIRVKFIGRHDHLDPKIVEMCDEIEARTIENTAGTIVFALDYSGQDEIIRAANAAVESGTPINDRETFETFMDTGDLLPIDLVVRSSGEQRISNFMLWSMAYAELLFYPKYWPALRKRDFQKMLDEFARRQRRYGK